MLVTANILWGANYAITKFAFGTWNPLAFSMTRFVVAGVVFSGAVHYREGRARIARADIPLILAAAAVGIVANQLFFTGATDRTTAGNVVLILTSAPALAAVFAISSDMSTCTRAIG